MTGRKKIKLLTFCLAERFLPFMALLSTYILIFCTFAPDFSHRGARVIRAEIIPIEPDPGNAGRRENKVELGNKGGVTSMCSLMFKL